jgi:hypothetical protein
MILTGVSSGLLLSGSPVTSSIPGTLGAEYVVLYTRPDGRWTQRAEWCSTKELYSRVRLGLTSYSGHDDRVWDIQVNNHVQRSVLPCKLVLLCGMGDLPRTLEPGRAVLLGATSVGTHQ